MRRLFSLCVLGLAVVVGLSVAASADYTLVGKIPAPQPGEGICPVTGLASAGANLFATMVCDTTSFIYLIRPSDGLVLDSYAWDIPYGALYHPHFDAAAYQGGVIYWVADSNNRTFLKFQFDDGSAYLHWAVSNDHITAPTGLLWQDMGPEAEFDALWVTDPELDSLYLMEESGLILEAYALSGISHEYGLNPTSVTRLGDALFFTSGNYPDSLFETTLTAGRVGAHHLAGLGEMDVYGATFHDGLLYVAGYGDSILVYSPGSYGEPVPTGDSVIVHVIPNELDIGFTHVDEAGSLYVQVLPAQACPPPEGVHFFGDFYEVSTTATFDYITKVALMRQGDFPAGVNAKNVRVFVRPSGECTSWRDITVDMIDVEDLRNPVLERLGKRLSEDDEFSVFAFAEDKRKVTDVIALKFDYLDSAITQNQSWIPQDEYTAMKALLAASRVAYNFRRVRLAARGVDRIAGIALATAEIPHTYDPMAGPGGNVAGRIISRAHTLSFSLQILLNQRQIHIPLEPSWKKPPVNIVGDSPGLLLAVPNPSSSGFVISFNAPQGKAVTVKVYSVQGELVRTLAGDGPVAGVGSVTWDGRNDQGVPVAAGTYFAVLEGGDERSVRKMVLER
jgi:hypothetical protein